MIARFARGRYRSLRLQIGAVAAGGLGGAVLVTLTAPGWKVPVPVGRVEVPGLRGDVVRQWAFGVGLVLLAVAWLALVRLARTLPGGDRVRLAAVCALAALWAVPLLVGPPLQSRDAYSYVAQAEMAARGIDPSTTGPSALDDPAFTETVSPNWIDAPAPYGPLASGAGAAVAVVAGHDPGGILTGVRLLALAGVVLAACCLPAVARAHGVAPATAFALGIANPVVAVHLVGGGHNDALVLGLVLLAFWARAKDRNVFAILAAAAAAAVKLPALVAVVYLGWTWAAAGAGRGRRLLFTGAAVAAAAAVHVALSALTGTGWGVLTAVPASTQVTTDLSLPQVAALLVHPDPGGDLLDRMRLACLGLAACVAALIWWHRDRLGALRATGLTLLAVSLLAPVLHPWYPAVGLALVAACRLGRWRPVYLTGVLLLTFALRAGGGGILADAGQWRRPLIALPWVVVLAVGAGAAFGGRPPWRRRMAAT